jgi:hypothetical protein
MKKWVISIVSVLVMSISAWAAAATGMPALDDLFIDVHNNGPLSKRLGFTDEQRKNIEDYIGREAPNLIKLRDELVAAEKKVERKDKKKVDKTNARNEKDAAATALNAARDDAFRRLQPLMTEKQYDGLKKHRAEGKARAN